MISSHEGEITNIRLLGDRMVSTSHEDKVLAIWKNYLSDPNALSTQLDNPVSAIDCF
jgi:uncharacterized Zn finger protein